MQNPSNPAIDPCICGRTAPPAWSAGFELVALGALFIGSVDEALGVVEVVAADACVAEVGVDKVDLELVWTSALDAAPVAIEGDIVEELVSSIILEDVGKALLSIVEMTPV